ncbi:protein lethal(2)essential for life-like [Plodia interpunctella]|uniref:protein lethal(2)essential for life-like n=1 Tax=Plodia interpunctella TaxID=58824 RepID=UPI0023679702|nr:protein lethal(2)essential for life-like [Plodia interpunctella]
MALLPYLFGDLRPRRLPDQLFGLDLSPSDLLMEVFDRPSLQIRKYMRPWRTLATVAKDIGSTIKTDKDKFQVNLDVQHFAPEEISVKTADGYIIIEGKHEEKQDEHGYVSRQFKRRYALPDGCNPETVESKLSSDGVLSVTAPKSAGLTNERAIPITHTGPVRRKAADEEPIENGEASAEEEVKSPQKKRRR